MPPKRTRPGGHRCAGPQELVPLSKLDNPLCTAFPLWLQREAESLRDRGPRAIGEILFELIETFGPELRDFLRARLSAYNAIPRETYAALRADRFPAPFGIVEGGRR